MTHNEKLKRIEQLKKEIARIKSEHDYYQAMQLAYKLILNGTYGAFCHPAFTVSNTDIANSITSLAREVINYMLDHIEDYFYNKWHLDKESHSLLGSMYISKLDEQYFLHRVDGKIIDKPKKDDTDYSGVQKFMEAYNLVKNDLVETDIKEFKIGDKTYTVLHKIFIHDFSKVKALPTDFSIEPQPNSKSFDAKRGVREVPIIIYGDTDSLYISFSPIMKTVDYTGDELKFILHVNACFIKHLFNDFLEKYAEPYGVKNIHDFELETINKAGLHLQKKMYINNTIWQDGAFYEDLSHLYPKGVDIVRSSTPAFVREKIWDFLNYLFTHPHDMNIRDLLKIVKDIKKQFMMADIEDISQTTSCTNYEQKVIEDQTSVQCVKGAHFSIKAAALHNYLLNKNPEFKTKYDLIRSGKIKYYSILPHPLGDKFAYTRSFHPNEIVEKEGVKIDYDEQFDKTFLSIANRFVEPVGLPTINRRLAVLNSLFGASIKKAKVVEIEEEEEEEKIIHTVSDFIGFEDDTVEEEEVEEVKPKPKEKLQDIKTLENSDDMFDDFWS